MQPIKKPSKLYSLLRAKIIRVTNRTSVGRWNSVWFNNFIEWGGCCSKFLMELCAFPSLGQPCLQQGRLNTLFLSLPPSLSPTLSPFSFAHWHIPTLSLSPHQLPLSIFPQQRCNVTLPSSKGRRWCCWCTKFELKCSCGRRNENFSAFSFPAKGTTTPMRAWPSVKCNPCQFFCYYWVVVVLFFVFFRSLPPKSFGSLDRIFLNRSFAWPTQTEILSGRLYGQSVKVPSSPTQSDHHRFNFVLTKSIVQLLKCCSTSRPCQGPTASNNKSLVRPKPQLHNFVSMQDQHFQCYWTRCTPLTSMNISVRVIHTWPSSAPQWPNSETQSTWTPAPAS